MTPEAASVYRAGVEAMSVVLPGMYHWADSMLEGSEKSEALFHLTETTRAFDKLVRAIEDYEGTNL